MDKEQKNDAESHEEVATVEGQNSVTEESPKAHAEELVSKLETDVANLKDQLLRAFAETENVRRRSEKQVEDSAKFAITNFARDLISVAENLNRTTDNLPQDNDNPLFKSLAEGLDMTKRELNNIFTRHGIIRIEPAQGEKFDHNVHQAVAHVVHETVTPGSVIDVMQAGYMIKERLLRPAIVTVAKSPE